MSAYYNEFEPFAAAWLRELIKDGLIADGEVDGRSITDVEPADLKGFTQCHFFAGIGGWSYALRLAGWSDSRPVWTGSPPCQPFSVAGTRRGKDDERHLWPAFFNLIRECQPPTVFGEQVASAIRGGWFDDLQADMERENYATGVVVLPACSIGSPHKRDRLWFVANSLHQGSQGGICRGTDQERETVNGHTGCDSADGSSVGNSEHNGLHGTAVGRSVSESEEEGGVLQHQGSDTNWTDTQLIHCRDNKYRPIPAEPALFPLADGIPNRVGILRGAG
ncbi:MAG: DNA cytosine methyltransferase, partial [Gammaproteobacteria bacterium]|nr:DNA cytosine methyltransferase [Gammaproteobacteria bacterium]